MKLGRGRLLLAVAAAMLAAVVVLYQRPADVLAVLPTLGSLLSAVDPPTLLVAATAMLGFVGVAIVVRSRLFGEPTIPDEEPRTESSQSLFRAGSTTRGELGATFDGRAAMATEYGEASREQREAARRETVAELRRTAATAVELTTGVDGDAAREAVGTGAWTTDDRAAGLLADDEGPSIPLVLSAWDLLVGRDPFETSVEHAISAIEDRYEDGEAAVE